MSQPYRNPYQFDNPDHQASPKYRQSVMQMLESRLMNSEVIPCISLVSERGMGGNAVVREFFRTREPALRVIECNVKTDLIPGQNAADFYRSLVVLVSRRLPYIPPLAARAADRIARNSTGNFGDLGDDLWEFFAHVRAEGHPLLLVFYYFDRLPQKFKLSGEDLSPLRKLSEDIQQRKLDEDIQPLYYLTVSRRPLGVIEKIHGLEQSLFATHFLSPYYVGLLSERDARALIVEPAQRALGREPWSPQLAEQIFIWGGRHPYCTELICSFLFERIWIHGNSVEPGDFDEIKTDLKTDLYPFFDRLCRNLTKDGFLEHLLRVVASRGSASLSPEIHQLIDLGYFLPEALRAPKREYVLFSPLFHQYLVDRGLLLSPEPPPPPPVREEVEQIVKLAQPPADVREGSRTNVLTEREREVLGLVAEGLSNSDIAAKLFLSEQTVKDHVSNILAKLGVKNRTMAVNAAKKQNLL